jgi:hypothetical protein
MSKQNSPLAFEIEGINFITDSKGERKAVVIDLEKYNELLEDFFDVLISKHRLENDETISLEEFKKSLT